MRPRELAVLVGGGIESTTLLRDAVGANASVVPVFVQCGLAWEAGGRLAVSRVCSHLASPVLQPLVTVSLDLTGLMPQHHVDATPTSTIDTRAQLEVPLRNLMLTAAAANAFRGAGPVRLAIGTTADNSFGDGSRRFFDACQEVLSLDLSDAVHIETPYIGMSKWQVVQASDPALLSLSWSCVTPGASEHCGRCIKCRSRRKAFQRAGVPDPTRYQTVPE